MPNVRFSSCKRGPDGYPPYVRGWFCMAREGTMQRGYRDVGYLLAGKLNAFQPRWLSLQAWRYHLNTLLRCLKENDERSYVLWFAVTYPGLGSLIPAKQRQHFFAGFREVRCHG